MPPVRADACPGEALLFSDLDETELLTRISDGDPLRLEERVARHALERAVILDGERICSGVLALVATSPRPRTRDDIDEWLGSMIDVAIDDLVCEDRERLASETPAPTATEHAIIERSFGVRAARTLDAAVAFNSLQHRTRRAFMALFIEGRQVPECIEAGLGTSETLRADVLSGFSAITGREPAGRYAPASMGNDA